MVDKRPIGAIAGKSDYLEKKVPKNPKYSHVGPTVNTGFHMNHIEFVSDKKISKRKGELFRRIKPTTLASLLKRDTNDESVYKLVGRNEGGYGEANDDQSVYSAYTSQTGYSEASKLSSITSATEQLLLSDNSEFLLLDLREPEEYELYHIKEAINYPAPNLGRDKIIPEIFKFKNKEDKLIVIYHLDERSGIPYANQMGEKGFDNVYLITGGIEAFLEKFPQFVEGKKVPVPLQPVDKKNKVLYKRSKHVGCPEEGDVVIPSKHIEDDKKSVISNITRTTNMTASTKTHAKENSQNTSKTSKLSSAPKVAK